MLRSSLHWVFWGALLAGLALLVVGYCGHFHPLGDSLAVFRLHIAAVTVLLGLLMSVFLNRKAIVPMCGAILLALPAALSYVPENSHDLDTKAIIYQKNLYFRAISFEDIAQDILASGADIVLLEEVSTRNMPILDRLREAYPSQGYCKFNAIGGTAVLSRWPLSEPEPVCSRVGGMTALRLDAPAGPLWAVAVHLHWPWPYGQARHVAELLPELERLEGPVVVGGDFNMVPWGASVRQIAEVTGTVPVGPTLTTLRRKRGLVLLPIDHVLLPKGWRGHAMVRPELGSDHKGLLVHFDWSLN